MAQLRNDPRATVPDIGAQLRLSFAGDDGVVLTDDAGARH
jgi:hypothetical protein